MRTTSFEDVRKPHSQMAATLFLFFVWLEQVRCVLDGSSSLSVDAVEGEVNGPGSCYRDLYEVRLLDHPEDSGSGFAENLHSLLEIHQNKAFCHDSSHGMTLMLICKRHHRNARTAWTICLLA
jgi:hypothetical protein